MSLYELGETYLAAADRLTALIARRRQELAAPEIRQDQDAAYRLNCELRSLYVACREARETAAHLMHYYDPAYHRKESCNL